MSSCSSVRTYLNGFESRVTLESCALGDRTERQARLYVSQSATNSGLSSLTPSQDMLEIGDPRKREPWPSTSTRSIAGSHGAVSPDRPPQGRRGGRRGAGCRRYGGCLDSGRIQSLIVETTWDGAAHRLLSDAGYVARRLDPIGWLDQHPVCEAGRCALRLSPPRRPVARRSRGAGLLDLWRGGSEAIPRFCSITPAMPSRIPSCTRIRDRRRGSVRDWWVRPTRHPADVAAIFRSDVPTSTGRRSGSSVNSSEVQGLIFTSLLSALRRRRRGRPGRLLISARHVGRFMHLAQLDGWEVEGPSSIRARRLTPHGGPAHPFTV